MLNQIEGIVLNTRDYGETHKIITVFTKSAGKISAICRGANKPKSKLASVSQRFIRADFLVYLTKGLSTIQQGLIIDSYRHIREDIVKTAYTSYLIELTEKILEAGTDHHALYYQLEQTMDYINTNEDYMVPIMMYELKLYEAGGFAPVLNCCVNCSRQESIVAFSIQEGGFLCTNCIAMDPYVIKTPPAFSFAPDLSAGWLGTNRQYFHEKRKSAVIAQYSGSIL